jgi:hypothetical protein
MTNIFDILKGILFTKKSHSFSTIEDEKQFDLYMVNRWCSMVDKDCAKIINETTNKFGMNLDSKQTQYKFLQNVLPKYNFHKINYIKRKVVD